MQEGGRILPSLFLFYFTLLFFHAVPYLAYVPVNSKTAHPPWAIPGYLTCVKLRTVGNLTQNEARPVGHLAFVSKRLSAVGNKRISQFFDSACEPRSRIIALFDSVFLLLSLYLVISWNMPLFKVWSEDKLNKKFVVAENFVLLEHLRAFKKLIKCGLSKKNIFIEIKNLRKIALRDLRYFSCVFIWQITLSSLKLH